MIQKKIELLIDSGVDVDFETDISWGSDSPGMKQEKPLFFAQDLNRYDYVYKLIKAGANYEKKDAYGNTFISRMKRTRMTTGGELYQYFRKTVFLIEELEGESIDTSEFETPIKR